MNPGPQTIGEHPTHLANQSNKVVQTFHNGSKANVIVCN